MSVSLKQASVTLLLFFVGVLIPAAFAEGQVLPEPCSSFDTAGLTLAEPGILVQPEISADLLDDSTDSCVVVLFALKALPNTEGHVLVPSRAKSMAWSEDVPRSARKATEQVIKKWRFFSGYASATKERAYYYIFRF